MASDYYSPPEVVAVMGLVDTYLRWSNVNQAPRGFERYHPSAFGKCLRKMQYDRYVERGYIEKVDEDTKPSMLRVWGNGHSMHDRWRQYFEDLGILRGYWECTNPFCYLTGEDGNPAPFGEPISDRPKMYGKSDLQGVFKPEACVCGCTSFRYHEVDVTSVELNFYGHCDAIIDFSRFDGSKYMDVYQSYMPEYLPQRPVVVDFKTINMFDFPFVAKGNPHFDYIIQLTIYANILDCDFGILMYENKNDQTTCSFRVDLNPPLFAKVCEQAEKMNAMVDVEGDDGEVLHLLPPPRPKNQNDKQCKYCKYKDRCFASSVWDDPDLDAERLKFYGDFEQAVEPEPETV